MFNFFSKYKFIFYLCNFILIFLYLFPGSLLGWIIYNDLSLQPQITPNFIISSNHLYAFIILSIIGLLTFNKTNHFRYISLYLIVLSLTLELMHYLIPERSFEFSDLFGNLLGVIIVIFLFYFFNLNEKFKN